MTQRTSTIARQTNETRIDLQLRLDGTGDASNSTGIGFLDHLLDDAAELPLAPGKRAVITMDAIVSGIHFPDDEQPQKIASRLVRVNLSDLAAMGAKPRVYTVALALPAATTSQWVAAFAAIGFIWIPMYNASLRSDASLDEYNVTANVSFSTNETVIF